MENIDLKREYKELYQQSDSECSIVDVPRFDFLMVDGKGDPNTSTAYSEAVESLYPFAYGIRSVVKAEQERKFVVMPLEGRWWADDMDAFHGERRDEWRWTLMILQPDFVTERIVEEARETVRQKKNPPRLDDVRYASFEEGKAAQVLHVGPYHEEGPTIERLHEFVAEEGYTRRGRHHEIYLSDARRTDPERLRTILRQPVEG